MLFFILFAVLLAACAQEMYLQPYDGYPEWYISYRPDPVQRQRRDVTVDKQIGDGRVFGTLGQNDNGLFGKAGYDRQIFNDERGKLNGELYGSRVLGPYGDSSHFGGGLKWENPNAAASLDISRQIHVKVMEGILYIRVSQTATSTPLQAAAGGKWPVGKNGDFSLQGTYGHTSGMRPEFGGIANYNYRW